MHSFLNGKVHLHAGDCFEVLDMLPENSVDSIVTDPPYHLLSTVKRFAKTGGADRTHNSDHQYGRLSRGFMGKSWDGGNIAFQPELWAKCLRVLKPGGHLVAFAASKNSHRMVCAIEDAGFEVRDCILDLFSQDTLASDFWDSLSAPQRDAFARVLDSCDPLQNLFWAYGSGFPKSLDVSKAIDRAAGASREKIATGAPIKRMIPGADQHKRGWEKTDARDFTPGVEIAATEAAKQWAGWGTALKPAFEPICLARKPLGEATVAANVLAHGTGAINIDGCRVGVGDEAIPVFATNGGQKFEVGCRDHAVHQTGVSTKGRWPANIIHDGSDEVVGAFPNSDGQQYATGPKYGNKSSVNVFGDYGPRDFTPARGDTGSAARFFYSSKAGAEDRIGSKHPTVKPVDLMQWLCRLITPPGGVILDPFAGSGSTGEAAWREGFTCHLIEREPEYQADIAERMRLATAGSIERTARKRKQLDPEGLFANDVAPAGNEAQKFDTLNREAS